ncbi:unnamed protein product [Cylicostephanus goldi]|uniref:Uncharacterized protein n=1 Tax=Cylicostephanus goldi TaxID=71465 RepID=A0A3P6SHB7_CYLGO|nr:unnamed protein product [Cylicostephanus goldi]
MQDLAAFDSDEPYLAVIGPNDFEEVYEKDIVTVTYDENKIDIHDSNMTVQSCSERLHSMIVVSRGAMTALWDSIHSGRNGCGVASSPHLCLDDIVILNLKEDAHERSRHNGRYNDGSQVCAFTKRPQEAIRAEVCE